MKPIGQMTSEEAITALGLSELKDATPAETPKASIFDGIEEFLWDQLAAFLVFIAIVAGLEFLKWIIPG